MKIYNNFVEYIEHFILPRQSGNPDDLRLDGWDSSQGNREILGIFWHQDKVWKVHGDTRYEPLLIAYEVIKQKGEDPFIERLTVSGKGNTLVLKDEFKSRLSNPKKKYLYIYEHSVKR